MLLKGSSWEKDVTAMACVGWHLRERRFSQQLLAAAISLTWQLPCSATGQASKIPRLLSDSLSISDGAWIASGFLCSPHCINERCYIKNSRWQQNPFISPDAFGRGPLFSHPPLTQSGRRLRKEVQIQGIGGLLFEVTTCESAREVSVLPFGCTALREFTEETETNCRSARDGVFIGTCCCRGGGRFTL